ncbi:DsbA family protein [Microbacterium sp. YY-03]|uniref:DsbA family protein n=1 Tax=Microbacterium sp. YY-03 TaxID=3421636 RepID=UPI003D177F1B
MGVDGNHRAEQRRELADKIRSDHQRSTRKLQILTTSIVILGMVAAAGSVLWLRATTASDEAEVTAPQHATDDYGFMFTLDGEGEAPTEATRVDVYEDFLCSTCKVFQDRTGAFLTDQAQSGTIALVYHPLAFLKNEAGDDYSLRAANAAACVADVAGPSAYAAMHGLLLVNQPAYDQPGLTDEQLASFATEVGATDVADCIAERTFGPWVEAATQAALRADVHETPTVRVDGMGVVKSDDGVVTIPGEAEIRFAIEALR